VCKTRGLFLYFIIPQNPQKVNSSRQLFENNSRKVFNSFSTEACRKVFARRTPKQKRKTHFAPAGGQAKTKVRPRRSGGRARRKEQTQKGWGRGRLPTRGRQPEGKILELFLIVSRGSGGDEKIFPNMEKSAVKPRFLKQNICSVLRQKCWGAGGGPVEGA
jgi:hypothetical protein